MTIQSNKLSRGRQLNHGLRHIQTLHLSISEQRDESHELRRGPETRPTKSRSVTRSFPDTLPNLENGL